MHFDYAFYQWNEYVMKVRVVMGKIDINRVGLKAKQQNSEEEAFFLLINSTIKVWPVKRADEIRVCLLCFYFTLMMGSVVGLIDFPK